MVYIDFKDKGFEKALKNVLTISPFSRLTQHDLCSIEGVIVTDGPQSGFAIPWSSDSTAFRMMKPNFYFDINKSTNGQWKSDLFQLTHIKSLHLYVPTQELSGLSGFIHLKELYVVESENRDWTFLPSLLSLRYLYIKECFFSDLRHIRELYIQQINRYELMKENPESNRKSNPFNVFQGLSHLSLIGCEIMDITPLAACSNIDELNLSHNEISDISPLKGMRSLYYLTMRYNKLINIETLKELKGIYLINLRHNQISNIEALASLAQGALSRLFLGDNPIVDYRPLRNMSLVAHDINQFNDFVRDRRKRKRKRTYPEAEDMIGRWSDYLSFFIDKEDTIIAFEENGTGFLMWGDLEVNIVQTFTWSMNNSCLNLCGINNYLLDEEELTEIQASELKVTNERVWKYNELLSPEGSVKVGIKFEDYLNCLECNEFYLESKEIWDTDYYKKLRLIIWRL